LLAATIGGGAGWIGPKIFDPANAAPAGAITRQAERISAIAVRATALEAARKQLSTDVTNLQDNVRAIPALTVDVSEQQAQISALSANELITNPDAIFAPLTARIDAVETLLAPEGETDAKRVDGAAGRASDLLARISALEEKLETLQAAPPQSREPVVLSYSSPEQADASASKPRPLKTGPADAPYDLGANFPKQAMLAAMSTQKATQKDPSWIRKLLGRHVQSDDDSAAKIRADIERAHAHALRGDIKDAINIIETLNPTVRAAAHQWMIDAKKRP
jgi:hypothetical protein